MTLLSQMILVQPEPSPELLSTITILKTPLQTLRLMCSILMPDHNASGKKLQDGVSIAVPKLLHSITRRITDITEIWSPKNSHMYS